MLSGESNFILMCLFAHVIVLYIPILWWTLFVWVPQAFKIFFKTQRQTKATHWVCLGVASAMFVSLYIEHALTSKVDLQKMQQWVAYTSSL